MSEFNITLAQEFVESTDPFPVDFDLAWQWMGFATKASAKRLLANLEKDVDFSTKTQRQASGRPLEKIVLSLDSFLTICMEANTEQGRKIREYILKQLKIDNTFDDWTEFDNTYSRTKDRSGFVYLLRDNQTLLSKIGRSKKPRKKLSTLQTGNAAELVILTRIYTFDCVVLEKELHKYYSKNWVRGEWFDLSEKEILSFVTVANNLDTTVETTFLPDCD